MLSMKPRDVNFIAQIPTVSEGQQGEYIPFIVPMKTSSGYQGYSVWRLTSSVVAEWDRLATDAASLKINGIQPKLDAVKEDGESISLSAVISKDREIWLMRNDPLGHRTKTISNYFLTTKGLAQAFSKAQSLNVPAIMCIPEGGNSIYVFSEQMLRVSDSLQRHLYRSIYHGGGRDIAQLDMHANFVIDC